MELRRTFTGYRTDIIIAGDITGIKAGPAITISHDTADPVITVYAACVDTAHHQAVVIALSQNAANIIVVAAEDLSAVKAAEDHGITAGFSADPAGKLRVAAAGNLPFIAAVLDLAAAALTGNTADTVPVAID